MDGTIFTALFTALTVLGGGVITYLLQENQKLKADNAFLLVSLYDLTSAIQFTDSVSDDSKLHDVAKEIKEALKSKIESNARSAKKY